MEEKRENQLGFFRFFQIFQILTENAETGRKPAGPLLQRRFFIDRIDNPCEVKFFLSMD